MELPSSPKPCLLWLFVFCLLNVSAIVSQPLKQEAVLFGGKFQALYVIGDSLVDSGNNNYLSTKIKANFAPYGSDFEGGKPTGRFSNGKTIADYIGKNMQMLHMSLLILFFKCFIGRVMNYQITYY